MNFSITHTIWAFLVKIYNLWLPYIVKIYKLGLSHIWYIVGFIGIIVSINVGAVVYEKMNDCIIRYDRYEWFWCHEERASHALKPLILLYPEKEMDIRVKLEYAPGFTATFPEYDSTLWGWSVTATPESIVRDKWTNMVTYGLFWEWHGATESSYDLSTGFVVRWSEVRELLYDKLRVLGLTPKEYSDFIMFWYPKLQDYPYVQITFAGREYTDLAKLSITPTPDSVLRVFMVAKPLDAPISLREQKLFPFERKGFTVVEWGGTILE